MFFIIFPVAIITVLVVVKYLEFRRSEYKAESGNSFIRTVFNLGNHGEFLTFAILEQLRCHKRLMVNLYIPKKDGTTTEIDLIMIAQSGIYVFESKNLSGWIYGHERNKQWTQVLKNGQKNRFLNPVWQNRGHISALKQFLGKHKPNLFKSYIVFSERCRLKDITVTSPDVVVIKRNELLSAVKTEMGISSELLSVEEVDEIYVRLLDCAHVGRAVKQIHIDSLKARM